MTSLRRHLVALAWLILSALAVMWVYTVMTAGGALLLAAAVRRLRRLPVKCRRPPWCVPEFGALILGFASVSATPAGVFHVAAVVVNAK